MKYPKLVKQSVCKTPIIVNLYTGELGEDGEPVTYGTLSTLCNYQSKSMRVFNEKQQLIEINGVALFAEDIFENVDEISSGTVEIYGELKHIRKGYKARNPDGTVNYVKLEIM